MGYTGRIAGTRHCPRRGAPDRISLFRGTGVIRVANPLLQHYIKLTEFLGYALGPDYEVALHDLTDKDRSIVAIANNHVSGRDVGAPLTNMALRILRDKSYENRDYILHYLGVSSTGKTLRSSTMFIKKDGKLVGMLCINFDDSRYQAVSDALLRLCHPDQFVDTNFQVAADAADRAAENPAEHFPTSIHGVAADAVMRELEHRGITASRLNAEERIQIISALDEAGIFLLKGAVKDVADALECSQASIYRYLTLIRRDES